MAHITSVGLDTMWGSEWSGRGGGGEWGGGGVVLFFFFFNDTATTEIYTLSLHDALPILAQMDLALLQEQNRIVELVAVPPGRSDQHAWPVFCERL